MGRRAELDVTERLGPVAWPMQNIAHASKRHIGRTRSCARRQANRQRLDVNHAWTRDCACSCG